MSQVLPTLNKGSARQRSQSIQRSLGLMGLALTLLLMVSVLFFTGGSYILSFIDRQERINVVLPLLRQTFEDLQDAETGQRGFVLTGKPAYLEPYQRALGSMDLHLDQLDQAYARDPVVTRQLRQIRILKEQKFAEMAETIRLRREHDVDAALGLVQTDKGRLLMDQLRVRLTTLIDQLSTERRHLSHHMALQISWARYWLALMGLLLVILVGSGVSRLLALLRINDQLMQALEKDATHDPLTGLPNRRYFFDWLNAHAAQAARLKLPISVLFIDLDGFKAVNDIYGHEAGDELLKEVAQRFRAVLRASDLLSRIGGDEFAVIAPNTASGSEVRRLAERMVDVLKTPLLPGKPDARVGASIGVAVYPNDGINADTLLACADQRMYKAKQGGKGQVCMEGWLDDDEL